VAIGYEAVKKGYRVSFVNMDELMKHLKLGKRQILNTGSGALLNIPLFGHSIIAGYMI